MENWYFVFFKTKFGTWSYDSDQINLVPLRGYIDDNTTINNGIDLSEFYMSIEWDVMDVRMILCLHTLLFTILIESISPPHPDLS